MSSDFYKLVNGEPVLVRGLVSVGDRHVNVQFLTDDEAASAGVYHKAAAEPVPAGMVAEYGPWQVRAGVITRDATYVPASHDEAEYDAAMEEYLLQVRTERGYTTREPSAYATSSVQRWRQDAEDWVAFRDAVMSYAIDVMRAQAETGEAPTLEEFKSGFPTISWRD